MANTEITAKLRERARGQIIMLVAQFLLGMGVNLIGLPDETSGGAKKATQIFLGLHVLISLGLLIGAILCVVFAIKAGVFKKLAQAGAAGVVITITAGVLTMATGSNWWSYLMAVGFMASLLAYASLYSKAGK